MPNGPMLSDYRAVLFDVDGTLVDSLETIILGLGDAVEHYIARRPSDDEFRSLIGIPLRAQMEIFGGPNAPIDAMSELGIERMAAYSDRERLFDPAVEVLRLAHRSGIKTGVVTSKSAPELAPFLHRFPAAAAIDVAVCATDVLRPKPDPESAASRALGSAYLRTRPSSSEIRSTICAVPAPQAVPVLRCLTVPPPVKPSFWSSPTF